MPLYTSNIAQSEITDIENNQTEKTHEEDARMTIDEQKAESIRQDVFGNEEHAEVKYKTLKWWYVPSKPTSLISLMNLSPGNVAY
jgi:hypothetical protein